MRTLTDEERRVVLMLAAELESDQERRQLLADLDHCTLEPTLPDESILRFDVEGYQRPPNHGLDLFRARDGSEVVGIVKDADGAEMEVLLLADVNRRIWEFEIVRYHDGPLIKPDWDTFRVK